MMRFIRMMRKKEENLELLLAGKYIGFTETLAKSPIKLFFNSCISVDGYCIHAKTS
jgi:hypothetical protein